jgi:hypothetical protein
VSRILCIDYCMSNFHNLVELAHDGHTVFTTDNSAKSYYESFGITVVDAEHTSRQSYLEWFLSDNQIDTILYMSPYVNIPDNWNIDVIGLNERSAHLETRKLWCRRQIGKLGVKLPVLLDDIQVPCVVKPNKTHHDAVYCTFVVLDSTAEQYVQDWWIPKGHPYYVEEYLDGTEVNIEFVVSGGKWSIQHCQESTGENVAKIAGNYSHFAKYVQYGELSDDNRELCIENATKILDWVATLGGQFQGQITGMIKDGEWYFLEINSRLATPNSLPIFVRGDEYLESLSSGKPEILGDAIYMADVEKIVVRPRFPDSVYPFHLHEKYGVSVPCGLDIVDDEYQVARGFEGIVIIDREIPLDFVKEMKNNLEFIVSH